MSTAEPGVCRMIWKGRQSEALLDTTHALDVEGAIRAAKTTICLWKELNALIDYPGIHTIITRWTDDATDTLLRPLWTKILRAAGLERSVHWNSKEHCYEFSNGSRAYMLGLRSPDELRRYSKFRGLTLARAYNDQSEELPEDIYRELKGRLSQQGFPRQIVISPNAVGNDHWIAREFPPDNTLPGRKYITLSVYDNAHNLDVSYIRELEDTYPEGHPKRRTMIHGLRGLNVIGEPVYKGAFNRQIHELEQAYDRELPLDEGIDFGKHHPCVVWRQTSALGQVRYLGGILGQSLFLEDFIPLLLHYRTQWFPEPVEVRSCCDPAGASATSHGMKDNGVKILQRSGIHPRHKSNSNSPDVRLAMVERTAGLMRRRVSGQKEAFVIAKDARWLRISTEAVVPDAFLADGFEAGYVWDEHMVSVGSKQVRKPKKDGWYEHGQNCQEYLELNFGAGASERKVDPADLYAGHMPTGENAWMGL